MKKKSQVVTRKRNKKSTNKFQATVKKYYGVFKKEIHLPKEKSFTLDLDNNPEYMV